MADIPRDPRQLARDILSGKIKLEDLQRERQRQGGMPPRPAPPPPPPPRQMPPPQPQVKSVPIGPGTQFPKQVPSPSQRKQPPRQVPTTVRGPQFPGKGRQFPAAPAPIPEEPRKPMPPPQPEYEHPADPAKAAKAGRRALRIKDLMKSKLAVRQGIILSEVLGKPVSLRDE